MIDKKRILQNLKELVNIQSVSGTEKEVLAAYKIEELILGIPYFKKNKENVMLVPIDNDPLNRVLAVAYLECNPKNPNTVILTGHYDVVDTEEFGNLRDVAYDIDEITQRINELPLSDEVRKDYDSGEWYFGRGVLDMKYGHALCIELLRHYSELTGVNGNLLYIGVCGEETNSEGMLAAVPFLNRFAEERSLKYKLLLLTEGYLVENPENGVKYIQYGAAGKLMPMFFCVGATTHGEEPLLGLDANILSAEVYRQMALNPEFCQKKHVITTAPPVGLKMQDMKENYSLSTTLFSASYYSIATLEMNPAEIMSKLKNIAQNAFDSTLSLMNTKVEEFKEFSGHKPDHYEAVSCVMTYSEIYEAVKKSFNGDLQAYLKDYATKLTEKDGDMQNVCIKLLRHLYDLYKDKKPMIIATIIPPFYPDVNIDTSDCDTAAMLENINDVIEYAKEEYGETVKTSEYYGTSDLCYTWLSDDMDFDTLFENLIGINTIYQFPTEAVKKFKVPGMVLGCAGRDMHKYTERLEKHYNFDVLPDLYIRMIDKTLR